MVRAAPLLIEITTPACGHLINAGLASVPPSRRGALPFDELTKEGDFNFLSKVPF